MDTFKPANFIWKLDVINGEPQWFKKKHGCEGEHVLDRELPSPSFSTRKVEEVTSEQFFCGRLDSDSWLEIGKHLSARDILTLRHIFRPLYHGYFPALCPSRDQILTNILVEHYFSGNLKVHQSYRKSLTPVFNRKHQTFFDRWKQNHLSDDNQEWVKKDVLRQGALARYLSNRIENIKCTTVLTPSDSVFCAAGLPDGGIVFCSKYCHGEIWKQNQTGRWGNPKRLSYNDRKNRVAVLPDGKVITGWSRMNIPLKIWSCDQTGEWQHISTLPHTSQVFCFTTLPDGRIIVGCMDGTLTGWRLDKIWGWQPTAFLSKHKSLVRSIAILSTGQIVSGSNDQTLIVWSCDRTGKWQAAATMEHGDVVSCVAGTPDGRIISVSWSDGKTRVDTLKVWCLNQYCEWKCTVTLSLPRRSGAGIDPCLATLADGRIVLGSEYLKVISLDQTGNVTSTLRLNSRSIWGMKCVTTLADGRIISGSTALEVWDLNNCIDPDKGLI